MLSRSLFYHNFHSMSFSHKTEMWTIIKLDNWVVVVCREIQNLPRIKTMEKKLASLSHHLVHKRLQIQKRMIHCRQLTFPPLNLLFLSILSSSTFLKSTDKQKTISSSVCNQIETTSKDYWIKSVFLLTDLTDVSIPSLIRCKIHHS